MATNEIAVREHAPAMVRLSSEQLQYIAHTEFVPKSMRNNLPAILACVAYGRELGLGDMVALRNIHMIDGRPALSAEVMVGMVRDRGHSIQGNFSGDSCTASGKRIDNGDEITVTWTRQMAVDAGLVSKNNWKSFPASMLWARSASQLCRMLFADCFAGSTHTPEEISDGEFDDYVEIGGESEGDGAAYGTHPGSVEPESASGTEPLPANELSGEQSAGSAASGSDASPEAPAPSAAQIKKLNVLVGTLREAERLTTEQVWDAAGYEHVASEDGELHWSPLRDSLTKGEASNLIEWLTAVEAGASPEREDQRLGPDPSRSEAAPLTVDELKERAAEAGISLAKLGAVGKELFPNRGIASDLTDGERGEVLARALASAGLAAGATVDG